MHISFTRFRFSLAAGLLTMACAPGALALEAEDVADRLKAVLSSQQIELEYSRAELSGNNVTLQDVTVTTAEADARLALGTLTMEDVREQENGSYRIGNLEVEEFSQQEDDVTFSFTGLEIVGLVLPQEGASDPFGGTPRYDRVTVARLDVEGEAGKIATADNFDVILETSEEEETMDVTATVEAFWLNLDTALDEEDTPELAEELGYQELRGSALLESSWRASDGRLTLSRYETTVDDAGALNVMLDMAGYTPEFAAQLRQLAEADGQGDDSSMHGMAVLGLLQQLTLHEISLRFTDDGLTEKALDKAAREQGSRPADIISQIKATIPMQLSLFVGSELANQIASAVGTFLENPETIEIRAKPAMPLPIGMLAGAAMASPEMLVKQIGLRVVANE